MNENFQLIITAKAKGYFLKHVKENQYIDLKIKPSGCSGYSTVFSILDKEQGKKYLTFNGVSFSINEHDQDSLNNTIVDLKQEGLNQKVIFENPQAIHHCGCGESFGLKNKKE